MDDAVYLLTNPQTVCPLTVETINKLKTALKEAQVYPTDVGARCSVLYNSLAGMEINGHGRSKQ